MINDSPIARWSVLIIVAFTMMMGYFITDVMSPLEQLLEQPIDKGGLGWSSADYGFFSGSSGFINVFLLMLFFSGLILDKMGVRFTGVLSCSLMIIGVLIKLYAITAPLAHQSFHLHILSFIDIRLPLSAALASLGFAVFGVGYEMCGITVSKVCIGLVCYLIYCVMDRKLEAGISQTKAQETDKSSSPDASFRLSDIGAILRNPGFSIVTFMCMVFYSAISPFLKFATKLMIEKYSVAPDVAGFITSIAPYGTIILTPLFGRIYDKYGHGVTLIIIGTTMLAFVYFGFSLPIHSSIFAIFLMVILGIAYSLVPSALWPGVPKMIPLKCLGTAYSMIFFIQNFGRSVIPVCVGKANETDSTYTTSMLIFFGLACTSILIAILLLWVDKRKKYGLQKANITKNQ